MGHAAADCSASRPTGQCLRGRYPFASASGPAIADDGETPIGSVHIVDLPDPDRARAVPTPDGYADIEVHNWRFGGRPSGREDDRG